MRRGAGVAVLGALLLAGCTGGGQDDPAPDPDDTTTACAEVRAGIDAFNLGDYESTQIHFKRAVPLAEDEQQATPGRKADDLLEAIRYYADLAPDDYPESARSSPDFAKYKRITLGQCVPPVSDDTGELTA